MQRIARYIREGAMAFLVREYKVLAIYARGRLGALFFGFSARARRAAARRFLVGRVPVAARRLLRHEGRDLRATCAPPKPRARSGKSAALVMALDGGAVMGLCVAGLGLIGLGGVYCAVPRARGAHARHRDPLVRGGRLAPSRSSRASAAASTPRPPTSAPTSSGKVEANIPEDDPRNPGVIADNVGDNVGDVAGMGADIYESYVAAIVAAMALGLTLPVAAARSRSRPTISRRAALRVAGRRPADPARDARPRRVASWASSSRARSRSCRRRRCCAWRCSCRRSSRSARRFLVLPMFGIASTCAGRARARARSAAPSSASITDYYTSMGPVQQDRRGLAHRPRHQRHPRPRRRPRELRHPAAHARASSAASRTRRSASTASRWPRSACSPAPPSS